MNVDEAELLSQSLLIQAAKELNERACTETLPGSKIAIKHANFQRFQRKSAGKPIFIAERSEAVQAQRGIEGHDDPSQIMPLPLNVETQFEHSKNDKKRSMKSITRFYQAETCIAEITLIFDFYTATEAAEILKNLGYKTFESFANKME